MLVQTCLDKELWQQTFERLSRNWNHLRPDQIKGQLAAVWNCFNIEKNMFCGLVILIHESGRFLLVRSWYDQPYDEIKNKMTGRLIDTAWRLSRSTNMDEAILEFASDLSQQEQDWLNLFLYLRRNPAYQG